MNVLRLLSILYLLLLCLTATHQEAVEFLALYDSTTTPKTWSENGLPVAVQVETQHLENVSRSVLTAEAWVRSHVLAYYPAINISSIIVGHSVLCDRGHQRRWGLVLPSTKNIHYSLTRWGLHNDIKVAASFSSDCLDSESEAFRVDVAEIYVKPLLGVLQEIGSPYVVNPPPHLSAWSAETMASLKPHSKAVENLGDFNLKASNVIVSSPRKERPAGRKLLSIGINMIDPFPPRPTPIAPSHYPSGSSNPAYAAGSPLPPLVGVVSPQPDSLPFAPSLAPAVNPSTPPLSPHLAPMANPASPPFGPHLPPCDPAGGHGFAGAPVPRMHSGLWCVAKPNVPPETLQEALDYACGEGGADCEAINTDGSCYFPDTLVAHASYAFNSYWQKTKKTGGACGFGGTAMLVNSDPSYNHCIFSLA